MSKSDEETRLESPQNNSKAGLKSQTPQENTAKMKIWKLRQRSSNARANTFWAMIG